MAEDWPTTKVGLIGHGAIGSVVAEELLAGAAPGVELVAVVDPLRPHETLAVASLDDMLPAVDVVVEAAGHQALSDYGPRVVRSGKRLLIVSVGALADDDLHESILSAGGHLVAYTTGAIGGIDTLRAAARAGGLDQVAMVSTKPAANLLRDWMDDGLRAEIEAGERPVVAFEGTAREACRRFPESANVFATLALATIGLDSVEARLVADPGAKRVRHQIRASGRLGEYEFTFDNRPSRANPKTSAVVAHSVLRGLGDIGGRAAVFV